MEADAVISPGFGDVYLLVGMRAIMAYLRAHDGPAEIHASMFDMSSGEFTSALYRLKSANRIRRVAPGTWEIVG